MKKRITLIMALVMVLSFSTGVISKTVYENIKAQLRPDFVVEIDGDVKEFKNVNGERVHPILYDGTTYLPIRAIGEIMGKTVYWYEDEKRIELKDEKSDGKTTVTDADVIVDGDDKPAKEKADKEKAEKDKADKEKIDKDKTEKDKDKINAGNKTDKAEFVGFNLHKYHLKKHRSLMAA